MFRIVQRTPLFCYFASCCYFTLRFTHHSLVKFQGNPIFFKDKSNTQQMIRIKNSTEGIILNRFKQTPQRINSGNFGCMAFFMFFFYPLELFATWLSQLVGGEMWVRDIWMLHASILINVQIVFHREAQ